jgi:hypothetical protein
MSRETEGTSPFGPTDETENVDGQETYFFESFLRSQVARETWENDEHCEINESSNGITVRHSPKVLDQVDQALRGLRGARRPSIRVGIYLIPRASVAQFSAAPLTKDQADRLRGSEQLLAQATVHHATPFHVKVGRSNSYLGDFSVEVAQESRIADPEVFQLWDGLSAKLMVGLMANGELCVQGKLRISDLLEMRIKDCEATWLGRLQLPTVQFQSVWTSGCFESGGGLLIGAAGADSDNLVMITATKLTQSSNAVAGADIIATVLCQVSDPALPRLGSVEAEDSLPLLSTDDLSEALRALIDVEMPSRDQDPFLWVDRGGAVVGANAGVQAKCRDAVKALEAEYARTANLELRYGYTNSAAGRNLPEDEAGLAQMAASLDGRMLTSSMLNADFQIIAGREQAIIAGYDVEIASKSQIADPIVKAVFSGVWFRGNLHNTGQGTAVLTGEFLASDAVQEPVSLDPKCTDVGVVELQNQQNVVAQVSQSLDSGRWAVIHAAKKPGQEGLFVLLGRLKL